MATPQPIFHQPFPLLGFQQRKGWACCCVCKNLLIKSRWAFPGHLPEEATLAMSLTLLLPSWNTSLPRREICLELMLLLRNCFFRYSLKLSGSDLAKASILHALVLWSVPLLLVAAVAFFQLQVLQNFELPCPQKVALLGDPTHIQGGERTNTPALSWKQAHFIFWPSKAINTTSAQEIIKQMKHLTAS